MLSINKYYKTKVDGEVDYVLANVSVQIPNDLSKGLAVDPTGAVTVDIDTPLSGNKLNVVIARYVGYSSSEDQDVYEVTCVGGSKFLTDIGGCDDSFNNDLGEYVKTVLSTENRAFVNSGNGLYVNPMQVASILQTKNGYNTLQNAEDNASSVACYQVTLTTGDVFITNLGGINNLDDNWC